MQCLESFLILFLIIHYKSYFFKEPSSFLKTFKSAPFTYHHLLSGPWKIKQPPPPTRVWLSIVHTVMRQYVKRTEFVFPWFSWFLASRRLAKNLSVEPITRLYCSATDVMPAPDGPGFDMFAVVCPNDKWRTFNASTVNPVERRWMRYDCELLFIIVLKTAKQYRVITNRWCYRLAGRAIK